MKRKPAHQTITIEFSSTGAEIIETVGRKSKLVGKIRGQFAMRGKCGNREALVPVDSSMWKKVPAYREMCVSLLMRDLKIF